MSVAALGGGHAGPGGRSSQTPNTFIFSKIKTLHETHHTHRWIEEDREQGEQLTANDLSFNHPTLHTSQSTTQHARTPHTLIQQ